MSVNTEAIGESFSDGVICWRLEQGTLDTVCVSVEKQQVWFGLVWGLHAFGRVVLGSCYRFPLKLSVLTSGIWVGLSLQPWAVDTTTLLVSDICWEELPLLSFGPYSSEYSPSTHPQPPNPHTGQCVLLPTHNAHNVLFSSFHILSPPVLSPKLIPG